MEEKLINYFSSFRPLSDDEATAIKESMEISVVPKGTILLKEGQAANDNYFVLKGCVRQYYLKNGEENISHFFSENEWILPAIDHTSSNLATYYLETTEECHLVVGNEQKGEVLLERFPAFQKLSMQILEKEIMKQHQQMATYQNSSPEERYLALQQDPANLIERITQYHLASYIGIKPESLSRIRKRLAES